MKNIGKMAVIVTALAMSLINSDAKIVKGGGKADVAEWGVELVNGADRSIVVHLSDDRKAWSDFDLEAGRNQLFKSDGDQVDNVFLKLATSGKSKEYKLKSGTRYIIKWNDKANRWDLTKLQPSK